MITLIRSPPQGTETQGHNLDVATFGPRVHVASLPEVTDCLTEGLTVQVVCPVPNYSSHLLPYKPYAVGSAVSYHTGPEPEVAEEEKCLPFSWLCQRQNEQLGVVSFSHPWQLHYSL